MCNILLDKLLDLWYTYYSESEVNTMKALIIDYNTYLDITDKLAKLNIIDIIWKADSFVIWYL